MTWRFPDDVTAAGWLVFVSDVDPHRTGIGASEPALTALPADPGLDVVAADPREEPPAYC